MTTDPEQRKPAAPEIIDAEFRVIRAPSNSWHAYGPLWFLIFLMVLAIARLLPRP
jgi:hypothetical protein